MTDHPGPHPALRWFHYEHLPEPLRSTSREFYNLAHLMADRFESSAELSAGLRKLLEAKDCAVRCARQQIGGEPERKLDVY